MIIIIMINIVYVMININYYDCYHYRAPQLVFGVRGERLHARTRESENPLEDATESPLDISSEHPLGK